MTGRYAVELTRQAEKVAKKIPAKFLDPIMETIVALALDPRPHGVKMLTARGEHRLRKGDYRILYFIDDEKKLVVVAAIQHRKDVYR